MKSQTTRRLASTCLFAIACTLWACPEGTQPGGNNGGEDSGTSGEDGGGNGSDDAGGVEDTGGGGDDGGSTGEPFEGRAGLFGAGVGEVVFEIDYQPDAAPYTSGGLLGGSAWTVFEANADALFAGNKPTLTIPTTLPEMEELTGTETASRDYTTRALLDIAKEHRDEQPTASRRTFYVVFIDGYFADETGRRANVLGVSLGDTNVIGMFKPVIDGTSSKVQVEQTTLVHEFGHAAGLVNNGVAMVGDHHDSEHGAHCTNRDCVMYYQNESGAELDAFIQQSLVGGGDEVVFGSECLADTAAQAD